MSEERWLPIVGFEGLYEVSDFGRVRSVDRILPYERRDQYSGRILSFDRKRCGQILRAGPSNSGHLSVVLGRGQTRSVHTLVLEAFVGPCPEGHESCHGDDDPINNKLENLRWGTRSDNLHDAIRNGKKPIGEKAWNAKLSNVDVASIKARIGDRPKMPRGLHDRSLESMTKIATEYGVGEATIRQIVRGRTWKHIA